MRSLLDTCVVSEVARQNGNEGVKNQISTLSEDDLFLSVITIGEIAKGICLLEPGRKKNRFSKFLHDLEQEHGNRILEIDSETARIWGELSAATRRKSKSTSVADGLIAATAIRHGLRVMTRNVADFEHTGAMILNPWEQT